MGSSFKYLFFVSLMIIALHLQSCVDLLSDSDSEKDEPSIVFGDNIDGVKIWDDSLTVVTKLGRPSDVERSNSWIYWFEYKTGKLNYTQVTITTTPLLGNGVISMSVESPYAGTSKEGIGIGTERDYVLNKLGTPYITESDSSYVKDIYKYEFTYFSIDYTNKKANRISMFALVE